MKKVVILGAGVTGLAAGWHLAENGFEVLVLEKSSHVGGLASSFKYKDCTLDYGPHKIYTQFEAVLSEMKRMLGADLLEQPKKSKVRLAGKYFDYPVVITQLLTKLNPVTSAKCGFGFLAAKFSQGEAVTYEDYILQRFGKPTYELVFRDFASKVWGDPKTLDAELARARVSIPDLLEMFKRVVVGDGNKKEISAKKFYYPRQGIQEFSDRMVSLIKDGGGTVLTSAVPKELKCSDGKVTSVVFEHEGKIKEEKADFVISTIHLQRSLDLFQPKPPAEVLDACKGLKYRALVLLFLVVNKNRLFEDSFIFYPEKEFMFNRLSEQKAFSKENVPEGKTVLCAEITCDVAGGFYSASDEDVFDKVMPSIEKAGFCNASEVTEFFTRRSPEVYPVYAVGFKQKLEKVLSFTDGFDNFITVGRQGLFNYNNIDHCMDMAFAAADHVAKGFGKEEWVKKREDFSKYVIID